MARAARIPRVKSLSLAVALLMTLPLLAAEVRAACGALDYKCQIDALDKRVGVAGSTVKAVDSTLDAMGKAVVDLQSDFDSVESDVQSFANDANQVLAAFMTAYDAVTADARTLSDELISRAEQGRDMVDYMLADERDAYLAFVGKSGCSASCEAFRSQIAEMVINYQDTFNLSYRSLVAQMELHGAEPPPFNVPPLDIAFLAEALNRAPGFALFPIHEAIRAVSAKTNGAEGAVCAGDDACLSLLSLNELFKHLNESLQKVIDTVDASTASHPGTFRIDPTAHLGVCPTLFADENTENAFVVAAWVSQGVGMILESIGEGVQAWGMDGNTRIAWGADVAAEMKVAWKKNWRRTLGLVIRLLGKVVYKGGYQLDQTLADCRTRLNHQLMLCYLSESGDPTDRLSDCKKRVRTGEEFGI